MPFMECGGVRLHYRDLGVRTAAAPLLLVHGWGGDGAEWDPLAAAFTPDRRVVTVDLRGHGRSSVPDTGYAPADFAADLARLLRHLDCAPVVAVGHSMGGQVVLALADAHPWAVESLVALDPAYGADDAELARIPQEQERLRAEGATWAVRFVTGAFAEGATPAARARHERLMAAMNPRVLLAARDAMYLDPGAIGPQGAAEARLAALALPLLTVMTTAPRAAWARRHLTHPRSRVELVEGGHYVHEERPDRVADLLGSWLSPTGTGRAGRVRT